MKIPMTERRVLVKHEAKRYQKAGKREKQAILDRFVEATGYHRVYAAHLLRSHGKIATLGSTRLVADAGQAVLRKRAKTYGEAVRKPLERLWALMDYSCGKRLVAGLAGLLEALERQGEITLVPEVREKLLSMSAATADRLLAPERRRVKGRGRSGTKPGTLLKSQIPVRTYADWDEGKPGFLEMDLVAHDGGNASGEFVQTLDLTDVHSGWSEQRAVLNKAQRWVFEALVEVRERLPFPMRGLDSDNGGEFINQHLFNWCVEQQISMTRSRPNRKNDNCFVEQKNFSIVRRAAGYGRFVGTQAVDTLNALYDRLRLRTNFFLPTMKLLEKRREGSRVIKRYEKPQTPYERLLQSPELAETDKQRLRATYETLNPAALDREIKALQNQLERLARRGPSHEDSVRPPAPVRPPPPGRTGAGGDTARNGKNTLQRKEVQRKILAEATNTCKRKIS